MAIKIKKNGVVQDLVINANEVRVLDTDGNFRSKNLESVLKELNATGGTGTGGGGMPKEADYVFATDTEPTYDGVWLDTSEDCTETVEGDNGIVKAIRDYIDTDVKAKVLKNEEKVNQIKEQVEHSVGVVPELAKPNLLINGDFKINQAGKTSYSWGECCVDKWFNYTDRAEVFNDGVLVTMSAQYHSLRQRLQNAHILKGKKYTLSGEIEVLEGTVYTEVNVIKGDNKNITCYKSMRVGSHKFETTNNTPINDFDFIDVAIVNAIQGTTRVKIKWLKLEVGEFATPFIPKMHYEELLSCNDGVVSANSNILINGHFQIWQRGFKEHIGYKTNTYACDRWRLDQNGEGKSSLAPYGNGVKYTMLQNDANFTPLLVQDLEIPNYIRGQQVTFSVKVTEVQGNFRVRLQDYTDGVHHATLCDVACTKAGIYKVTATVPYDAERFYCIVSSELTTPNGSWIAIDYAKLELGTVATQFSGKSYSQELKDCQRYYQIIRFGGHCTFDKHLIPCVTNFPVSMRITPSYRMHFFGTGDNQMDAFGTGQIRLESYNASIDYMHLFYVQDLSPNKILEVGRYYNSYLLLDAEIY